MKTITVAITGASGSIYAQRLLVRLIESSSVEHVDLVLSPAGIRVVSEELGVNAAGTEPRVIRDLTGQATDKVIVHSASDIGATIASGSYVSHAMIIVPCSMGTLGCIANGVMRDLVHRAADVHLKESRPLILVPRETPL